MLVDEHEVAKVRLWLEKVQGSTGVVVSESYPHFQIFKLPNFQIE